MITLYEVMNSPVKPLRVEPQQQTVNQPNNFQNYGYPPQQFPQGYYPQPVPMNYGYPYPPPQQQMMFPSPPTGYMPQQPPIEDKSLQNKPEGDESSINRPGKFQKFFKNFKNQQIAKKAGLAAAALGGAGLLYHAAKGTFGSLNPGSLIWGDAAPDEATERSVVPDLYTDQLGRGESAAEPEVQTSTTPVYRSISPQPMRNSVMVHDNAPGGRPLESAVNGRRFFDVSGNRHSYPRINNGRRIW